MRISNLHEFWFTSKDGLRIACKRWDSRGPTWGVLQVAHGMGQHSGRSHDFLRRGRHELLNELNRGEVRTDLLVWLCTILRGQSHHSEALWAQQHQHHRIR